MDINVLYQTLTATVGLIDAVTPRGALRGEELSSVGQLREQAIELIRELEAQAGANDSKETPVEDSGDSPE